MRFTTVLTAIVAVASPIFAADATTSESTATAATTGVPSPSAEAQLGTAISQGCYSSWGDLFHFGTSVYNSRGSCATTNCTDAGYKVAAMTGGNQCWCGNEYPPTDTRAADSKCNIGCAGYPQEACGGFANNIEYFSVFNTGLSLEVSNSEDNTTSTSASGTGTGTVVASSTITSGGHTSVVYVTPTASSKPKSSSSNLGGIIAGVVVGVVVLLAIAGGLFFFMRRRKNREIEEEHRRNAAVSAFMKPPGSSGGYSVDTDARMDPVMAQRRLSSGSIADNQDYSRRILRVTNA
ncbi:hypothetical protein BD289DRAFT_453187 [Coniella lustricola]|uniref:WSC domain-containing protein n=1 Tax=Coniella lustricola TaxID=2025994 RepID=A0A2T3A8F6_9PEZI|nr:hypothetical protein BD289DRAFT_453187 [Coniella lustricola]